MQDLKSPFESMWRFCGIQFCKNCQNIYYLLWNWKQFNLKFIFFTQTLIVEKDKIFVGEVWQVWSRKHFMKFFFPNCCLENLIYFRRNEYTLTLVAMSWGRQDLWKEVRTCGSTQYTSLSVCLYVRSFVRHTFSNSSNYTLSILLQFSRVVWPISPDPLVLPLCIFWSFNQFSSVT